MSWNYRVYRQKVNDDPGGEPHHYSIREAYYSDSEEEPRCHSASPISPVADSLESLRWVLESMLKALDKPVLEHKEDLDAKDQT